MMDTRNQLLSQEQAELAEAKSPARRGRWFPGPGVGFSVFRCSSGTGFAWDCSQKIIICIMSTWLGFWAFRSSCWLRGSSWRCIRGRFFDQGTDSVPAIAPGGRRAPGARGRTQSGPALGFDHTAAGGNATVGACDLPGGAGCLVSSKLSIPSFCRLGGWCLSHVNLWILVWASPLT